MRNSPLPKLTELEFVKSVALAEPTARIVVIVVDDRKLKNGELKHTVSVLPVLAIETAVVWHWMPPETGREYSAIPESDCQLRIGGYQFVGEQFRRELIVFDNRRGEGLMSVSDLFRQRNLGVRTVVCEWPPSEDESQLAPIIAELIKQLKREVSRA